MPIEKFFPTFTFTEDRLQQLAAVVPEAFADGKVNWETLKAALGAVLETSETTEQFGLFWPGKNAARQLAGTPIKKTLVPRAGEGINEADTHHIFIEGDNLEALKLLHKSYIGKVKLIYIDPPYNTGNDFVYRDDYRESQKEYLTKTGDMNAAGEVLTTNYRENTKTGGRFHSNWLNMMLPRLMLARALLREDGVIFVSIDDNEVANLRQIMDEVFGGENFIVQIVWKKRSTPPNDQIIGANHEYIVVYAKEYDNAGLNLKERTQEQNDRYKNPDNHPKGPWTSGDLMANVKGGRYVASLYFAITNPNTGEEHYPSSNGNWRFNKEKIEQLIKSNEIHFGENGKGRPKLKRFLCDVKEGITYATIWDFVPLNTKGSSEMSEILGNMNYFDNPKPVGLINELIKLGTEKSSIVLDFFSGSCTTAQAVLELNREDGGSRHFIMVQLPESTPKDSAARQAGYQTIADIGKERIRRVIKKLADSPQAELIEKRDTPEDLGFRVFKVAPSHFKTWQPYSGDDVTAVEQQQGDLLGAPLIDGWTSDGLRAEVLLQHGLPLDSPCETLNADFPHNTVQCLTPTDAAHRLLICFDDDLHSATVTALQTRLTLEDTLVCFDRAFADDNAKLHLAEVCQLRVI